MGHLKKNKRSGMTLIETIVAFAIISIIIVVAMLSINTIANVNVKAQNLNTADEVMEEMIAMGTYADKIDPKNLSLSISDGEGASLDITIGGSILVFEHDDRVLRLFNLEK